MRFQGDYSKWELHQPLCRLFHYYFQLGQLPRDWTRANIVPIIKKKGQKSFPNYYRPVSLTCLVVKINEKCIQKEILNFLTVNSKLIQHNTDLDHFTCVNHSYCTLFISRQVRLININLYMRCFRILQSPSILYPTVGYFLNFNTLGSGDYSWNKVPPDVVVSPSLFFLTKGWLIVPLLFSFLLCFII